MRKTIIEKVLERKAVLIADANAADANQLLSQAAIIGGIHSTAWKTYMEQFVDMDADHDDQLMRLLATDGTDTNPGLSRARAYLVANGMCGQGTRTQFEQNVDTIDAGLPAL